MSTATAMSVLFGYACIPVSPIPTPRCGKPVDSQGITRGQLPASTATPSTCTSGPRRYPLPNNASDKGFWRLSTSSTEVTSTKKRHTSSSLTSLWVWIWGQGLVGARADSSNARPRIHCQREPSTLASPWECQWSVSMDMIGMQAPWGARRQVKGTQWKSVWNAMSWPKLLPGLLAVCRTGRQCRFWLDCLCELKTTRW